MTPPLTPDQLAALGRLDACTLANAIESFDTRLRNEGFVNGSIRCLFPEMPAMVGYAVTVKIRGASPPTGARSYLERSDWWDYLLSVPAPRVIVVEDISSKPGLGALLGGVHLNILRALGGVGAVTNGSVRDLPAAEKLGFPLYAGSLSVSHSYIHIVETAGPVVVGGLTVRSGDLLHGDRHGVQHVPLALVPQLPAVAARMRAHDDKVIALCRSGGFTIDKLRAAIAGRED
jgi:4-hydroxy-4-methyl-2-oxoglutarate aldolase